MSRNGETHRADAVLRDGTVVELQCSSISVNEIQCRERFYVKMIWVFDARDPYEAGRIDLRDRGEYYSFRWKQPWKSVAYATASRRLDLGDGTVLNLRRMSKETPCGGWGYLNRVPELVTVHA